MTNNEAMRKEFEEWYAEVHPRHSEPTGQAVYNLIMLSHWNTWEAALATRPDNSLIEENKRLREALEKIKNEAITLYKQDNAEFMRLGRDEVQKWDAPSRHLQTFSWLRSFCEQALSAKGVV